MCPVCSCITSIWLYEFIVDARLHWLCNMFVLYICVCEHLCDYMMCICANKTDFLLCLFSSGTSRSCTGDMLGCISASVWMSVTTTWLTWKLFTILWKCWTSSFTMFVNWIWCSTSTRWANWVPWVSCASSGIFCLRTSLAHLTLANRHLPPCFPHRQNLDEEECSIDLCLNGGWIWFFVA